MEESAAAPPAPGAPADGERRREAEAQMRVEAKAMERRAFESWAAFDRYMEEYSRATFQLFRKRTSTSVKLRNRRVSERSEDPSRAKKPRAPLPSTPGVASVATPAARLIPEHYVNYSMTLVCTHSGAFVSRGTGKRARQDVRATHCDAQINACLKLADAARDVYEVHVTRAQLTHNHRLDRETFGQYSNTRLNLPPALLDCVELMRRAGVKTRDIRAYIVEHSSCAPTRKDVQNLLTRLKHQAVSRQSDGQSVGPRQEELEERRELPQLLPLQFTRSSAIGAAGPAPADSAVDVMAQFQAADEMGRRVARALAEMPADRFADALRVVELAEAIVLERGRADPSES